MSESTPTRRPLEVRAPRGARVLEIDWDDGSTSRIRHQLLRGFCPCAYCQGHQGPIRWRQETEGLDPSALELEDLDEVGSYALRLSWGDQHNSGLYRFGYLFELGELESLTLTEVRAKSFGR